MGRRTIHVTTAVANFDPSTPEGERFFAYSRNLDLDTNGIASAVSGLNGNFNDVYIDTATLTPSSLSLLLSGTTASLSVSNLHTGASNTLQRSHNPLDPNDWHAVTGFVSSASTTNLTDTLSNAWPRAFWRVISQ